LLSGTWLVDSWWSDPAGFLCSWFDDASTTCTGAAQ
jgi:hypothetical protein